MPFKNPDMRRAYLREWYLKNRTKVIARNASYNKEHKDDPERKRKVAARMHEWYLKNRERILTRSSQWKKDHPDRNSASVRKCYAKNPEPRKERHREWMKRHPEKIRLYHFRRRVEQGCPPLSIETLNMVINDNVHAYGEPTCIYCGPLRGKKLVIDHLRPVARGGDNSMNNLTVSCFSCNAKKHTKTYEEFVGKSNL